MSSVYIVDGNPRELQALLLEAISSQESLDLPIRSLGELGVTSAHIKIDNLHILQDEELTQHMTDDEPNIPIKYVAVGKAAINGSIERTATLTIHEYESDFAPVGELEVLEDGDLG